MANGKIRFGKQSGGQLALVIPDGVTNTEVTFPESGVLATTAYVDGKMVSGTAVNSTSGTSIDFTGIPSWVKRITIMFNDVSTNGASVVQVQLGSGSITSTGYSSVASYQKNAAAILSSTYTTGFGTVYAATTSVRSGLFTFTLLASNKWIGVVTLSDSSDNSTVVCGGNVTLSGTLDRLRITTGNGTDTFDAGSINIMYEG